MSKTRVRPSTAHRARNLQAAEARDARLQLVCSTQIANSLAVCSAIKEYVLCLSLLRRRS